MKKKEEMPEKEMQKKRRDIDFFIPERCCPERFPSPQFPSPENCLPPDRIAKVDEKIIDANELLLDLALDDDRSIQETYQKAFDGLIGLQVEVTNQLGELIEGEVTVPGFDFVVLRDEKNIFAVPYGQIELIKPSGRFAEPFPDAELLDINPCFRRNLTFHFGEVVSSSPELIQLFFRIPLSIYLLIFEGKQIRVKIEDTMIEGLLTDVNKESIVLKVDGERNIIPIERILLITIKA
ncbi:hypothetical protein FITA111629_03250 [Filibacter tadaridae]|uniref:Uncharacterized protein n=1 Tax=Filibacter tadaridae TaxID=2483811 RepID=A0A3P5WZN9_9BACL|nr:hypothetical protein [Filibacter tadaridae]VDC27444.1 hypothetical protein FILTAD_01568 [Filibacter tadaridae]